VSSHSPVVLLNFTDFALLRRAWLRERNGAVNLFARAKPGRVSDLRPRPGPSSPRAKPPEVRVVRGNARGRVGRS
jgi:hypothetical protein